jgi:carboxyl-terminal processing protease
MSALADRAHRDVSAVIIDLRNNYGGVMQDALLDAAMFLPNRDDVICYTISPRGVASHTVGTWTKEGTSEAVVNDTPLIILLNEGTASSAELFAAGLHENSRAVLVGSRTFGKSQIQHFFPLPNGGALKLTVAEYLVYQCVLSVCMFNVVHVKVFSSRLQRNTIFCVMSKGSLKADLLPT